MKKYFTYKKDALRFKAAWQKLRFTKGKGYWLAGIRPKPVLMYDSIYPSHIPPKAEAVAGYVGGHWPTYGTLLLEWPAETKKLSIAVASRYDADCLDVEKGDATNEVAAGWVKRQQKRGVQKPAVYTFISNVPALLRALERGGVKRKDIRLFIAHWNYKPHICTKKCGYGNFKADATQFTNRAAGANGNRVDASLCSPKFFS